MTEVEESRFGEQIADSVESFLLALRAIAREGNGAQAVSLLLLEISQVLLAGARLGAQNDFSPREEYQPDVGPEADIDELRLRLAEMLGGVDAYSFVFDPYVPDLVESRLSDDMASIAIDLENGLRHFRAGNVEEALWWWQFLLRQQLGQPRRRRAQRAAHGGGPRPLRHRLRGQRGGGRRRG